MDALAAGLRSTDDWPGTVGHPFYTDARRHGVLLLMAALVRVQQTRAGGADVREWLGREWRDAAALELARADEARGLLADFHAASVECLLVKGAALAYSDYATPAARPRYDSDLFIREPACERAVAVLERRGFIAPPRATGRLVSYQMRLEKLDAHGVEHVVDLHWRLANPQRFADVFDFDTLASHSRPVPALGPAARAPGLVHSLAIACVHRIAHHSDAPRLIWIADIHQLAIRLSADQWGEFERLAIDRGIAAVCADGLAQACTLFESSVPAGLVQRLHARRAIEPSAEFLARAMDPLSVTLSNLRALDRWSDRARLVREHLFPPARYMKAIYGVSHPVWLPAWYARRAIGGGARWLKRRGAP